MLTSPFAHASDDVLREGDCIRTLTEPELAAATRKAAVQRRRSEAWAAGGSRILVSAGSAGSGGGEGPARLTQSQLRRHQNSSNINASHSGTEGGAHADGEINHHHPQQQQQQQYRPDGPSVMERFGVDMSTVNSYWESFTEGTWLNERKRPQYYGIVLAVNIPERTVLASVWKRDEELFTDVKRPLCVFPFGSIKKITPQAFNTDCKRHYCAKIEWQTTLGREGLDSTTPFALLAFNNRIVGGILDQSSAFSSRAPVASSHSLVSKFTQSQEHLRREQQHNQHSSHLLPRAHSAQSYYAGGGGGGSQDAASRGGGGAIHSASHLLRDASPHRASSPHQLAANLSAPLAANHRTSSSSTGTHHHHHQDHQNHLSPTPLLGTSSSSGMHPQSRKATTSRPNPASITRPTLVDRFRQNSAHPQHRMHNTGLRCDSTGGFVKRGRGAILSDPIPEVRPVHDPLERVRPSAAVLREAGIPIRSQPRTPFYELEAMAAMERRLEQQQAQQALGLTQNGEHRTPSDELSEDLGSSIGGGGGNSLGDTLSLARSTGMGGGGYAQRTLSISHSNIGGASSTGYGGGLGQSTILGRSTAHSSSIKSASRGSVLSAERAHVEAALACQIHDAGASLRSLGLVDDEDGVASMSMGMSVLGGGGSVSGGSGALATQLWTDELRRKSKVLGVFGAVQSGRLTIPVSDPTTSALMARLRSPQPLVVVPAAAATTNSPRTMTPAATPPLPLDFAAATACANAAASATAAETIETARYRRQSADIGGGASTATVAMPSTSNERSSHPRRGSVRARSSAASAKAPFTISSAAAHPTAAAAATADEGDEADDPLRRRDSVNTAGGGGDVHGSSSSSLMLATDCDDDSSGSENDERGADGHRGSGGKGDLDHRHSQSAAATAGVFRNGKEVEEKQEVVGAGGEAARSHSRGRGGSDAPSYEAALTLYSFGPSPRTDQRINGLPCTIREVLWQQQPQLLVEPASHHATAVSGGTRASTTATAHGSSSATANSNANNNTAPFILQLAFVACWRSAEAGGGHGAGGAGGSGGGALSHLSSGGASMAVAAAIARRKSSIRRQSLQPAAVETSQLPQHLPPHRHRPSSGGGGGGMELPLVRPSSASASASVLDDALSSGSSHSRRASSVAFHEATSAGANPLSHDHDGLATPITRPVLSAPNSPGGASGAEGSSSSAAPQLPAAACLVRRTSGSLDHAPSSLGARRASSCSSTAPTEDFVDCLAGAAVRVLNVGCRGASMLEAVLVFSDGLIGVGGRRASQHTTAATTTPTMLDLFASDPVAMVGLTLQEVLVARGLAWLVLPQTLLDVVRADSPMVRAALAAKLSPTDATQYARYGPLWLRLAVLQGEAQEAERGVWAAGSAIGQAVQQQNAIRPRQEDMPGGGAGGTGGMGGGANPLARMASMAFLNRGASMRIVRKPSPETTTTSNNNPSGNSGPSPTAAAMPSFRISRSSSPPPQLHTNQQQQSGADATAGGNNSSSGSGFMGGGVSATTSTAGGGGGGVPVVQHVVPFLPTGTRGGGAVNPLWVQAAVNTATSLLNDAAEDEGRVMGSLFDIWAASSHMQQQQQQGGGGSAAGGLRSGVTFKRNQTNQHT